MREVIYKLNDGRITKNYSETKAFQQTGGKFETIVQDVPQPAPQLSEKRRELMKKWGRI